MKFIIPLNPKHCSLKTCGLMLFLNSMFVPFCCGPCAKEEPLHVVSAPLIRALSVL